MSYAVTPSLRHDLEVREAGLLAGLAQRRRLGRFALSDAAGRDLGADLLPGEVDVAVDQQSAVAHDVAQRLGLGDLVGQEVLLRSDLGRGQR